jgi:hypothetical protein
MRLSKAWSEIRWRAAMKGFGAEPRRRRSGVLGQLAMTALPLASAITEGPVPRSP